MPQLVFITHGDLANLHVISGQYTILILVGSAYGFIRLIVDCFNRFLRKSPSAKPD